MAELKANNQKPNFDNNPKLIEAIAEMRKISVLKLKTR